MVHDRIRLHWIVVAGLVALTACGGSGEKAAPEGGAPAAGESATASGDPGGIPVSEPTGPIDHALADRGEKLFQQKGCVACHTIGKGRLTGPDLKGVPARQGFAWVYRQITRPDSMIQNDPTAKQLLNEYMTPMPNLNVQPDEAKALYEYIRAESAEAEGAEAGGAQGS